jgi:peptide-methionine (R)-S-oxide reductase
MGEMFEKLDKQKTEWQTLLPDDSYAVLFNEATEPAGKSALNDEKREGTFICAACYLPLFESTTKYNSGTGWPSFFDAIPSHVGTNTDFKLLLPRTEYHCARCGGHQGHIFKDGPAPTGQRYCNNGVALKFVPSGEDLPPLRS